MTASRILAIDIEGGFGGSSRSLFHLISALDRRIYEPTVWCRRPGPIQTRYAEIGVETRIEPWITSLTPMRSGNAKNWIASAHRLARVFPLLRRIRKFEPDILHLNHEGLVPLHALLCFLRNSPKTLLHCRSVCRPNWVYRRYAHFINRNIDGIIFITENELETARVGGIDLPRIPHRVVYNPVDPMLFETPREPRRKDCLNVVFLGVLDFNKAPERLIEIAKEIRKRRIPAIINAYGGSPRYKKWLLLDHQTLEKLRRIVHLEGLDQTLVFHGHTTEPEKKLAAADLLIRPSRANDPWGRDIIEALSLGLPVLTHGAYDAFVRTNQTGFLLPSWDAAQYVDVIGHISHDLGMLSRMSHQARILAKGLFDAKIHARNVSELYEYLLGRPKSNDIYRPSRYSLSSSQVIDAPPSREPQPSRPTEVSS